MKILQAIYTSCIKGQSGASGFQFYSYSDGFTEEELLDIEKRGNYIAPAGLPSCPSQEEIDKTYPVSFSYFRLKSGRCGVLQSVALDKDYSGRPGNFIAHALVLDGGEFPFEPIRLYNSGIFRTSLSEAELNVGTVPEKLPALGVEKLVPNPKVSLNGASDFLKENDPEGKLIELLVNAVIENPDSKRSIVLATNHAEAAQWIAALSFAFPARFVRNLTFSTYSVDPGRNNVLVCATTPEGSRFDFNSPMALNHQYYVLNFGTRIFSAVKQKSEYSEVAGAVVSFANNSKVEEFDKFLDKYNYPAINSDIAIAWELFAMQGGNSGSSEKSLHEALDFMFNYAKDETISSFWENPQSLLDVKVCRYILEKNHADVTELRKHILKHNNLKQISDLMPLFLEKSDEQGKAGLFWHDVGLCETWCRSPQDKEQCKKYEKQMLDCYIPFATGKAEELLKLIAFAHKQGYRDNVKGLLKSFESNSTRKNELLKLIFFANDNVGYTECVPGLLRSFELSADIASFERLNKIGDLMRIKEIKEGVKVAKGKLELFLLMVQVKDKKNPSLKEACEWLKECGKLPSTSQELETIIKVVIPKIPANSTATADYELIFPFLAVEENGVPPICKQLFAKRLLLRYKEEIKNEIKGHKNVVWAMVHFALSMFKDFSDKSAAKSPYKSVGRTPDKSSVKSPDKSSAEEQKINKWFDATAKILQEIRKTEDFKSMDKFYSEKSHIWGAVLRPMVVPKSLLSRIFGDS